MKLFSIVYSLHVIAFIQSCFSHHVSRVKEIFKDLKTLEFSKNVNVNVWVMFMVSTALNPNSIMMGLGCGFIKVRRH